MALDYSGLLAAQKSFFSKGATIAPEFRKRSLKLLKGAILLRQKEISAALEEDLGKSPDESYMSEIGLTLQAINWQIRHLDSLSRAHRHLTPLHEFPAVSQTVNIPYGNVLIMAPWNYPFLLTMVPLAEALAAGNTAVVKTGHAAKATSSVIASLIASIFEPDYVTVIEGGREEISALLEQKFDYIFFLSLIHI